jgi:hypothetical protein
VRRSPPSNCERKRAGAPGAIRRAERVGSKTVTKRKILTVITAATRDRIVIGQDEFKHAQEVHFPYLPDEILLELIELILKDPSVVYEEETPRLFHLFYRLNNGQYLVAIVKKADTGNYLSTLYPTGSVIRTKHKKLKKVKV